MVISAAAAAEERRAGHLDRGAVAEHAGDEARGDGPRRGRVRARALPDDAEDVVDAEALGLGDGPARGLLGDRVHELDAAVLVRGDDPVRDAPQRRREPRPADAQIPLELLEVGDVGERGDRAGDVAVGPVEGRGAAEEDAVGAVEALEVHLLRLGDLARGEAAGHAPVARIVGAAVGVEGAVLGPALHRVGGGAARPDALRGPVLQGDLAAGVADEDAVLAVGEHRLELAAVALGEHPQALDLAAQRLHLLLGEGGRRGRQSRERRGGRVVRLQRARCRGRSPPGSGR